jgi:hypothetical protein
MSRKLQANWWAILALAICLVPATADAQDWRNRAPVISGTPASSVVVGSLYSFVPVASDPDGDTLRFSIRNRPSWATFSTTTGRLEGTPQAADVNTYVNIVISVRDRYRKRSLPAFSIVVTPSGNNSAPVISGTPPTSVRQDAPYVFKPTATDADGDPLMFTVTNRPAWATFNNLTGALQGTPGSEATGTYGDIVIAVSDGQASTSLPAFAITVTAANSAPTISGIPPTTVTAGTPYAFTPTAGDVDGDPLTFSIANRPAWAAFDAGTGGLQGTPAAANTGTFGNIVISVSDGQASASLPAFAITVAPAPNAAPTISGTPSTSVMQGTPYVFQPMASDANGDALTFSIVNTPAWATFSPSTGRLQGTPTAANVGTTTGIVITVTDGLASTSLPAFNITVQPAATGSALLSWAPPTLNVDGSPLTNLAGFKVYWGTSPGSYPNTVTLDSPGLTTYLVESLGSGTYHFAVTAFNSAGAEGPLSNSVSKTIP